MTYPSGVRIDVWSDLVCPFCHLGRRHLELALEEFEHADEVGVVWHSFELDRAALPVDDGPHLERIAEKPGNRVLAFPTGHWVMLGRPREFNEALRAWLEATDRGASA